MSSKRMRTRKSQQLSDYEMETFLSTATLLNRSDLLVVQRSASLKVSEIFDFHVLYIDDLYLSFIRDFDPEAHPELKTSRPIRDFDSAGGILRNLIFRSGQKLQLKYRL